ncbi:hypothetical protein GQR36_24905 [Enterococcus termitis]|uniref:DUF5405 domain-containing protein n=2 Tax=Enterococcus termitis TaxID=332950 RepID=A0A1E5GIH9_9ENTE|nr:hypothetical protein BCR25_08090 [Enterococcus termitis]
MADKKILFQGTGYRILDFNDMNVVLELQRSTDNYKFQGYYTDIQKALHSIVRRDLLIDRAQRLGAKSYLEQIEKVKNQLLQDIDKHLNKTATDDDPLSLDDLLQ